MAKKVIEINEELCVGCGLCVNACQQSALALVDGKAKVVRDDYCDGLGMCLPVCPVGAIRFVEQPEQPKKPAFSCPGSRMKTMELNPVATTGEVPTQLNQWPVQIKLVGEQAPYFQGAHLLVAADCTAFAYGNFHGEFMAGKVTIIGCPKLDQVDYTEKLTNIFRHNDIQSVTVTRMEVPCCGGLERAVVSAVKNSGKDIVCKVVTISIDGKIL